jgi:EpsG family
MNFIPLEYYNVIFHYLVLFVVLITFFRSNQTSLDDKSNIKTINSFGYILLIILLLYTGFRPISYQFGDMMNYSFQFADFQNGDLPVFKKDILFEWLMYFFSSFSSANFFFFFCAVLYITPLYFFSKKVFKEYWFYSFLILIASFSFWAYGTNGIRNGIATSIFLFAFCQRNIFFKILFIATAVLIHQSIYIVLLAYVLTLIHKNNKTYFFFWLLSIPVSIVIGSVIQNVFLNIGFGDKSDFEGYIGAFDQDSEGVVLKLGFRWDFLIYSASAVFAAWFYIYKKKFNDLFYIQLVNIYLTINAFWILVIRANYSNRFAYLSWFMMGIIIIYPLIKVKLYKNQHQVIGLIIMGYCLFSFLLNVILA